MPSRRKKAKAVPFNPADVANIAKHNPYVHRLIDRLGLRRDLDAPAETQEDIADA